MERYKIEIECEYKNQILDILNLLRSLKGVNVLPNTRNIISETTDSKES